MHTCIHTENTYAAIQNACFLWGLANSAVQGRYGYGLAVLVYRGAYTYVAHYTHMHTHTIYLTRQNYYIHFLAKKGRGKS